MGFLWRRRSSVVKIVILLSAIWFTVAFLIYSEDRSTSNVVAQGPHTLELKYNNEFGDDNNDDLNENNINNLNDLNNNYNNKRYVNELQHQLNQLHLQTKNHKYNESVILNSNNYNNNNNVNSYNRNMNIDNGKINNNNYGNQNKRQPIPYQRRNKADAQKNGAGLSDDNGEYKFHLFVNSRFLTITLFHEAPNGKILRCVELRKPCFLMSKLVAINDFRFRLEKMKGQLVSIIHSI